MKWLFFRINTLFSSTCGFEYKIGIFFILFFKLDHPPVQTIRGNNQIIAHSIDQHSFLVVTHHEIIQILRNEFRVLFFSISGKNQFRNVSKGFSLKTYLDGLELCILRFQAESSWEYVGWTVVWNCSEVLHLLVGWGWEGNGESVILRQWGSKSETDVEDFCGVFDVNVVDFVIEVKVGNRSLSRNDQDKGQRRHGSEWISNNIKVYTIRL